jgi:hypothetical protein
VSHIVTVEARLRDAVALAAACKRLGLAEPVRGTAKLFSAEASGLLVKLPDWLYPVVVDEAEGTLKYDNYNGAWGDPAQLGRLLQAYAVEKARLEARRRGHAVREQALPDGSIRLVITPGGAP